MNLRKYVFFLMLLLAGACMANECALCGKKIGLYDIDSYLTCNHRIHAACYTERTPQFLACPDCDQRARSHGSETGRTETPNSVNDDLIANHILEVLSQENTIRYTHGEYMRIPPDGNCMYEAIARGLNHMDGSDVWTEANVRALLHSLLSQIINSIEDHEKSELEAMTGWSLEDVRQQHDQSFVLNSIGHNNINISNLGDYSGSTELLPLLFHYLGRPLAIHNSQQGGTEVYSQDYFRGLAPSLSSRFLDLLARSTYDHNLAPFVLYHDENTYSFDVILLHSSQEESEPDSAHCSEYCTEHHLGSNQSAQ